MDAGLAAYLARVPGRSRVPPPGPTPGTVARSVPFSQLVRSSGLGRRCGVLLAIRVIDTGLLMGSWVFIGSGALNGRSDLGWVAAWALCLISRVPLRMTSRWLEGILAIGFGGLLKERLLAGATASAGKAVRGKGTGELLGDVLEAETIERLGAGGALQAVLAAVEVATVPAVLLFGVVPHLQITVFAAWILLTAALIAANTRQRAVWTSNASACRTTWWRQWRLTARERSSSRLPNGTERKIESLTTTPTSPDRSIARPR